MERALAEDIGSGDVSAMLIDEASSSEAQIIFRSDAVLCGQPWVNEICNQFNNRFNIQWEKEDGALVFAGETVCLLNGNSQAILSAERTILNFLQLLSATANKTYEYCQRISHTQTKILDTRKTIPGLRTAQKYAVTCGGGHNHRIGLFDAFLIKENHIFASGSISEAVTKAKELHPELLLEVEVENLNQLEECYELGIERVLLDNFSLAELKQAVALAHGAIELEASGNIDLNNVADVAQTGVDYISIGSLTKDVNTVDMTLLFS